MAWRPNQNIDTFDDQPPLKNSPNSQPNTENRPVETQHGKEYSENRSHNVRRDTDTVKDFSITLEDIDTTIMSHLDKMQLQINSDGNIIPVPIMYGSPERWKAVQKDGFSRDEKGKIQLPLFMLKRNTIQRNESLRIFNRYPRDLSMPFQRKYSQKNQYDRFSISNNVQQPVHEVYNVNLPDHFIVTYECMIWTDLIEQNNKLVERIEYATEDYWGDKRRFKFRTTTTDFNLQTEVSDGQDRMVRTSFNLQVYAYLLPEFQKEWEKTVRKSFTPRRIVFGVELESDEFGNFPTKNDNKGYTGQGVYNNTQPDDTDDEEHGTGFDESFS